MKFLHKSARFPFLSGGYWYIFTDLPRTAGLSVTLSQATNNLVKNLSSCGKRVQEENRDVRNLLYSELMVAFTPKLTHACTLLYTLQNVPTRLHIINTAESTINFFFI